MPERLLISTDLDRTLLPNGPQSESPNARKRFKQLCSRDEITLAYISGRSEKLVRKAIRNFCLPTPDYVIGDVGSSMFRVDPSDQKWYEVSAWEDKICADWNSHSHDQLAASLLDLKDLRPQEPGKQHRHKLSYYVPMHITGRDDLDQAIRLRLRELGVRANLIWSVDELAAIGLLDILPSSASKLHALEFLMQEIGFDRSNTVFCGDSGNDMEILTSDIASVLVANAMPEVREQATHTAKVRAVDNQLYSARGDFLDMNGNYSAGILEGITHFHPQTLDWMTLEDPQPRPGA